MPCITADGLLQYFYDDIIPYPFWGIPRGFLPEMQQFAVHVLKTKIGLYVTGYSD